MKTWDSISTWMERLSSLPQTVEVPWDHRHRHEDINRFKEMFESIILMLWYLTTFRNGVTKVGNVVTQNSRYHVWGQVLTDICQPAGDVEGEVLRVSTGVQRVWYPLHTPWKVVFDKIKVSKKFEFIAVGSCNIPCNSLAVPQTLSILGFLTPVSIQIRE